MKKLIALFIAIATLLTLCVGCASADPASSSSSASSAAVSSAASSEPETEEKPTLKYLAFNLAFDPNKDYMAGLLEDVTGYKVEYSMLPAEDADQKLAIEISSGADYDILFLYPDQFQMLMSQGALLPLDDLLANYGNNILEGNTELSWKTVQDTTTGVTYGIPHSRDYPSEADAIMCRLDFMKDAGITKAPTTTGELYDCLKILKQAYPDKVPLAAAPGNGNAGGTNNAFVFSKVLSSAFGITSDWMIVDGKVTSMVNHPKMKELLTYCKKLYSEKLLDPDFPINTTSSINEKYSSGNASMILSSRVANASVVLPVMWENGIKKEDCGFVLPLQGSDGTQGWAVKHDNIQVTCIPKNSKHAEDAVKWINKKMEPDNFVLTTIGVEGEHFKIEDGKYLPIYPAFSNYANAWWYICTTDQDKYFDMWQSRVRKDEANWFYFDEVNVTLESENPDLFVDDPFSVMPSLPSYSKYTTSLNQLLADAFLQIISGTKTVDDLDSVIADWKNAGGAEVQTELEKWYSEFYG